MKLHDRSALAGCAGADVLRRALSRGVRGVAPPLFAVFVLFGGAEAAVPTAVDIAECTREAKERPEDRSSVPTAKDKADAEAARQAGGSARGDAPGAEGTMQSADPQLAGMDGDGAKDAVYRAAYRVCMRRKGF